MLINIEENSIFDGHLGFELRCFYFAILAKIEILFMLLLSWLFLAQAYIIVIGSSYGRS